MPKYYISRQINPAGDFFVEISLGGLEQASPGQRLAWDLERMEPESTLNPYEAMNIAIDMLNRWQKGERQEIKIAWGAPKQGIIPLELHNLNGITVQALYEWADEQYKDVFHCLWCESIIDEDEMACYEDKPFCSEDCMDEYFELNHKTI